MSIEFRFLPTVNWRVTPSLCLLLSMCFLLLSSPLYLVALFFLVSELNFFSSWELFLVLFREMRRGSSTPAQKRKRCDPQRKDCSCVQELQVPGAHQYAPFPSQRKDEFPADKEISFTSSEPARLESAQCPQRGPLWQPGEEYLLLPARVLSLWDSSTKRTFKSWIYSPGQLLAE